MHSNQFHILVLLRVLLSRSSHTYLHKIPLREEYLLTTFIRVCAGVCNAAAAAFAHLEEQMHMLSLSRSKQYNEP